MSKVTTKITELVAALNPAELTRSQVIALEMASDELKRHVEHAREMVEMFEENIRHLEEEKENMEDEIDDVDDLQSTIEGLLDLYSTTKEVG